MARRSSGWTVVKAIARDIERANRQANRAAIARQKAEIREETRAIKEQQKFLEKAQKEVIRTQDRFNKAITAANNATNISIKETKLAEARQYLADLKGMRREYTFFDFSDLSKGEKGIENIQKDIDLLQEQAEEQRALEQSAFINSEKAQKRRDEIQGVLLHTLSVNDALDWDSLKDHQAFAVPKPKKPTKPKKPEEPQLEDIPECPDQTDYKPRIPLHTHLFKKKKQALKDEAQKVYDADLSRWKAQSERIEKENQAALDAWKAKTEKLLQEWEDNHQCAYADWERCKDEHEENQSQYNSGLDELRKAYEAFDKEAIEEYCRLVLARSKYPFSFSKDYQIEYTPEAKLLALDYNMPTIDVVPILKDEKYIKSKGEIKQTYITDKQCRDIYESLLYAMVVRTIHELFEADTINAIESIALNGWVTSLNKATGHDETRCIMTVSVKKEAFLNINLANVDAKECFKSLKGIGGARLSELVPVAPVVSLNKEDKRFVDSYDVTEKIAEGDNLALMNWEDFEHLIRELFEKEFSGNGSEVRVTQASRDGGVDAVIFDPDPIRGGKIVVQAKRYTNTVGVSAVRDLYGTVQHEGALKGILITTSNYGSDAYDFAKGKPLALMNGGNLIHLLERHGKKARIDLMEAKKLLHA